MIQYNLGDVVLSLKGKDAEEFFTVVAVSGSYVYIADGKRYSKKFPKKKNYKHLKLISSLDNSFVERLTSEEPIGAKTFKRYIKTAIK